MSNPEMINDPFHVAMRELEETAMRIKAERDELLVALDDMVHYDDLPESVQAKLMERARAVVAKAQS